MQVPNLLFYDNMIKLGYLGNPLKKFMSSETPFLFIDVPYGREQLKGTSFCNFDEVEVVNQLKDMCLDIF